MAVKLDLRQRALAALGDYSRRADEKTIRAKMVEIDAEDHKGASAFELASRRMVIERDGDLSAFSVSPKNSAADPAPVVQAPKKSGRGGRREGAGRPKSIKGALSVWSVRVTEDERKALISALEKMRKKK